ncbi:protein of unknown function [Methylorubrum extorquens]|uniref:Uncharacterized protein n=1 Tax=Methylorubrum extorquens TaxID=408 RepID=A0A2N9AVJ3_METEX|nr:protein of unknown function [Methylorubrum extorquens]
MNMVHSASNESHLVIYFHRPTPILFYACRINCVAVSSRGKCHRSQLTRYILWSQMRISVQH